MAKTKPEGASLLASKLRKDLASVLEDVRRLELSGRSRALLTTELQRSAAALNGLIAELDPVDRPMAVFDPGNPKTVGFFVGLALAAQKRMPIGELRDFYGAGVYALYYEGNFEAYRAISGTETPIYVGVAVQGTAGKIRPEAQGTPLFKRLCEHRKNISRAAETLELADFSCRALVVQSGWESTAEQYLIRLFRPLWNRETKILYGFGKHGDSPETRKNKRSPWDTLHTGRKWAVRGEQIDAVDEAEILVNVASHFARTRVFASFDEVLKAFLDNLRQ